MQMDNCNGSNNSTILENNKSVFTEAKYAQQKMHL